MSKHCPTFPNTFVLKCLHSERKALFRHLIAPKKTNAKKPQKLVSLHVPALSFLSVHFQPSDRETQIVQMPYKSDRTTRKGCGVSTQRYGPPRLIYFPQSRKSHLNTTYYLHVLVLTGFVSQILHFLKVVC